GCYLSLGCFRVRRGCCAGGSAAEGLEGLDVKHLALIPGYLYNGGAARTKRDNCLDNYIRLECGSVLSRDMMRANRSPHSGQLRCPTPIGSWLGVITHCGCPLGHRT